jgi:hypothetical protein
MPTATPMRMWSDSDAEHSRARPERFGSSDECVVDSVCTLSSARPLERGWWVQTRQTRSRAPCSVESESPPPARARDMS